MDFNTRAAGWDNDRRVARAKIIADEIIRSVPVGLHWHALEFGCGTGLISFNLVDKFEHITLVDTSKGMIDTLNLKIQDSEVKNMTAFEADINKESIISGEFDIIYTSMALHHIADIGATLKNLYKLLKINGYLCIVELDEDDGSFHRLEKDFNGHNGFNQVTLKETLKKLGLENIETATFYNDYKIIEDLKVKYSLFLIKGQKCSE